MYIIVTGDSSGLGRTIVKKILEETEYNVIGISRTGSQCKEELSKYGNRYISMYCDLSNPLYIKQLCNNKLKEIGPIIGLVNNAAIAYDDLITNMNIDKLSTMYNVNVFSSIELTKNVIRNMILHKVAGSIVFVSSICVHTSYKGLSMYASTKGAIEAFSKGVAREWGGKNIRSNCVVPGFMETNMSKSLSEEQKNKIFRRNSLKKATSIESTAEAIVFLLSSKSDSITGSNIHVDNGTI